MSQQYLVTRGLQVTVVQGKPCQYHQQKLHNTDQPNAYKAAKPSGYIETLTNKQVLKLKDGNSGGCLKNNYRWPKLAFDKTLTHPDERRHT